MWVTTTFVYGMLYYVICRKNNENFLNIVGVFVLKDVALRDWCQNIQWLKICVRKLSKKSRTLHHVNIKINKILFKWCPKRYTNVGRCTTWFLPKYTLAKNPCAWQRIFHMGRCTTWLRVHYGRHGNHPNTCATHGFQA